jgi:hypothetical protein
MLKQEEALAELDASIDDWVAKLEQAENRRTRVRQKLLEHVAAAAMLPRAYGSSSAFNSSAFNASAAAAVAANSGDLTGVSESLHLAMGVPRAGAISSAAVSTPPRSPVKPAFAHTLSSSPSPQRVVAQVPSTIIEHPVFEEAEAAAPVVGLGLVATGVSPVKDTMLRRAETIRIYADNDVYALLADVENEISKMSNGVEAARKVLREADPRTAHRARSHDTLGSGKKSSSSLASAASATSADEKSGSSSSSSSSPSLSSTPPAGAGEIFLTSAVFRPAKPTLVAA